MKEAAEKKLAELKASFEKLQDNLNAHMGAIQVLEELLKPTEPELLLPVETE